MSASYNAFTVVMAHDICILVSTCNTLSCFCAAGDTAEELLGQRAVGKHGWGQAEEKDEVY